MIFRNLLIVVFLSVSLASYASEECGKKGTIEDRIRDCGHTQVQSFVLVTKLKHLKQTFQVFKDMRTNLLWSESLFPNTLNYPNAVSACEFYIRAEMGNISDVTWELPTLNMWKEANRSGIKSLPNMKDYFWTATEVREDPIRAYMFNGVYGDFSTYSKNNGGARVRCVAQTY
jgi:hypothetical protein